MSLHIMFKNLLKHMTLFIDQLPTQYVLGKYIFNSQNKVKTGESWDFGPVVLVLFDKEKQKDQRSIRKGFFFLTDANIPLNILIRNSISQAKATLKGDIVTLMPRGTQQT